GENGAAPKDRRIPELRGCGGASETKKSATRRCARAGARARRHAPPRERTLGLEIRPAAPHGGAPAVLLGAGGRILPAHRMPGAHRQRGREPPHAAPRHRAAARSDPRSARSVGRGRRPHGAPRQSRATGGASRRVHSPLTEKWKIVIFPIVSERKRLFLTVG